MYTVDTVGSANEAPEGLVRVMVKVSVFSLTVSSVIVNTMSTDSSPDPAAKVAVPVTGAVKSTPVPLAVTSATVVSEFNHTVYRHEKCKTVVSDILGGLRILQIV